MNAVAEIYGRIRPVARYVPLAMLFPFAAELLQHWAEIRLGMYAPHGMAAAQSAQRMIFGAIKVLTLLLTILFLLRLWGLGWRAGRALRPGIMFFKGVALIVAIQLCGDFIVFALSRAALVVIGTDAAPGLRMLLTLALFLVWLFFVTLLYPWFVGMIVEDRTMSARRSLASMKGHLWWAFGVLVAGILPFMTVHYALGYGAMRQAGGLVWPMMIVDAAAVAVLTILIASTQFTIYARAAERAPAM
jgi:hypothetical protein